MTGHVQPDDVIIMDIAGQALDIFLHGPESTHKNSIVKTSYSHIHSHIPMHTPQRNEKTTKTSKMLNSPNIIPLFTGPPPVQCAGG